jgi:hypothetical protein
MAVYLRHESMRGWSAMITDYSYLPAVFIISGLWLFIALYFLGGETNGMAQTKDIDGNKAITPEERSRELQLTAAHMTNHVLSAKTPVKAQRIMYELLDKLTAQLSDTTFKIVGSLQEENEALIKENTRLREEIQHLKDGYK